MHSVLGEVLAMPGNTKYLLALTLRNRGPSFISTKDSYMVRIGGQAVGGEDRWARGRW